MMRDAILLIGVGLAAAGSGVAEPDQGLALQDSCADKVAAALASIREEQPAALSATLIGEATTERTADLGTMLRVLVREFGYPEEARGAYARTAELDKGFLGFAYLAVPPRRYAALDSELVRLGVPVTYSREGPGVVSIDLVAGADECSIVSLSFELPASRPDARSRVSEVVKQWADEDAATH